MSKELINIISKDDLKTLVNQVYEQKKIYSESDCVKMSFSLIKNQNKRYYFSDIINLKEYENFITSKINCDDYVDDFSLSISIDIFFFNDEIDIDICCFDYQYFADFGEKGIHRIIGTVEETTNAIIELIEEINNKQYLFKLVWSE
ncbi:hypothetical protein [Campylobacter sp. RM12637]|uniref:hypothetical protein n=1 Tax=Campylobacter sp. RM12637 TaxID=2735734 RepID=UPI00301532B3|nr:hypothetical protein [Campylobacter sp. RM12637]